MNCHNHPGVAAIALCRICSLALCSSCTVKANQGFVCSEACRARADTIDRTLDIQKATLKSRALKSWFGIAAFLIVLGVLLVGERLIFGTPTSTAKVVFGFILLVIGVSVAFHAIYIRKQVST